MKEFTIERIGYKFEFRAMEEVNRDRKLRIGYKVVGDPKHGHNTMPGTDGYFNAEYHNGIIYFYALKLKGKKLDGLRLNDEELQKELDGMIDQAVGAEKAKVEAEIQAIKDGTELIRLYYHDGEYLSGYSVSGHAADLLEELGLAKYITGWGRYVESKTVEALGEEFAYQRAVEYARPAIEAKEAREAKRREEAAERQRETMKVLNATKPHQGEKGICSYCGKPNAQWSRETAAGIKYACEPAPSAIYAAAPSVEQTEGCLEQLMREHEAWAKQNGMVKCWECGVYRNPGELDENGYCGC